MQASKKWVCDENNFSWNVCIFCVDLTSISSVVVIFLYFLISRKNIFFFLLFQEDPPAGVSGAPCDNNIMQWNAVIFGPADTPFEDGTFKLTIS